MLCYFSFSEKLMNKMSKTIRARVSKTMAYRTKVAALLEIEGNIREQYARLGDYGRELQRVDPATTWRENMIDKGGK